MDKETISYLLNILRRGTTIWSGRTACINKTRVKKLVGIFKNGTPKYKYFYYCDECKGEFSSPDQIQVDHIIEVGPFNGNFDDYIRRLYCEQSNLQNLCKVCHTKKTSVYNSARIRK